MHKSPGDVLRGLAKRRQSVGAACRLRGRAWLSNAVLESGLEIGAFAIKHVYGGRSESNLVSKWVKGEASPTMQSVRTVEKTLPGTSWVFELPLWRLLIDRPLSIQETSEIASRYVVDYGGIKLWRFPGDDEHTSDGLPPVFLQDVRGLKARNDLWGLVGALIRVRQMEASINEISHLEASKNMFRALPGALKQPWLRPHADDLLECLERVRSRMFLTAFMYDVDYDVILRQADDPNHQPCLESRKLDPITHRFVEMEDPIIAAEVVYGSSVKKNNRRG